MKLLSCAIECWPLTFLYATACIAAIYELGPVKFLFFVIFMTLLKVVYDVADKVCSWCVVAFLWILSLIFPHSSGTADDVEDEGEAGI